MSLKKNKIYNQFLQCPSCLHQTHIKGFKDLQKQSFKIYINLRPKKKTKQRNKENSSEDEYHELKSSRRSKYLIITSRKFNNKIKNLIIKKKDGSTKILKYKQNREVVMRADQVIEDGDGNRLSESDSMMITISKHERFLLRRAPFPTCVLIIDEVKFGRIFYFYFIFNMLLVLFV